VGVGAGGVESGAVDLGGAGEEVVVSRVVPVGQVRAVLLGGEDGLDAAAVVEYGLREPGVRAVGDTAETNQVGRFVCLDGLGEGDAELLFDLGGAGRGVR
jgi:hypothetical protein